MHDVVPKFNQTTYGMTSKGVIHWFELNCLCFHNSTSDWDSDIETQRKDRTCVIP